MTKQETIQVLQSIEDRAIDFPNMTECDWVAIAAAKRHLQEEPVSEELENQSKKYSDSWYCSSLKELNGTGYGCIGVQEAFMAGANLQKQQDKQPINDDLEEAAKNHAAERYRTTRDRELAEKCKWSFKAGAKWKEKKDKQPISDDLSAEIDYLSKRYPEVSFAKLTRIAVHVAKWQKNRLMKDAIEQDINSIWANPVNTLTRLGLDNFKGKVKLIIIKQEEE